MTNEIVGAVLFAVFAFVLLRSLRVYRFKSRPRNHPPRERETLAAIVNEVYPEVPLHRTRSRQSRRPGDPPQHFPWMDWLERQKLRDSTLIRETDDPDWTGAKDLTTIHHIDADVFESVAALMQSRIRALTDVERPLQWSLRPGATVTEIDAHDREYAERTVRAHLEGKGHVVVFPEPHSRPRAQFTVDGKPFSFEDPLLFDYDRHLAEHSGIGMITSGDFFRADDPLFPLKASPRAHRLTMLTGTGLDRAITDDRAFANGGAAVPTPVVTEASIGGADYHSPVITLGLSSLREIRLLKKRHTDLKTAARNIGLDVAGTGVGGFAGAKAGATFGTAIAPGVGSVVGAIIGGIGGAIAGRTVTNRIKLAEAEAARVRYEEAVNQFQRRLAEVTGAARSILENTVRNEQARLGEIRSQRLKEHASLVSRLDRGMDDAYALPPRALEGLLTRCERSMEQQRDEIKARLRAFDFRQRTLWPTEEPVRLKLMLDLVRERSNDLSAARSALFDSECSLNNVEKTVVGLQLVAACGGQGEEIRNHLARYRLATERTLAKLAAYPPRRLDELARRRLVALNGIRNKTNALRRKTEAQLTGDVRKTRRAQNRFAKELRKLGLGK